MRYYFLFAFGVFILFVESNINFDSGKSTLWGEVLKFALMTTGYIVCARAFVGWVKAGDRPKDDQR